MEGAWKKPTSKQVHVIKAIQGLSPGNIFGSFFFCLFVCFAFEFFSQIFKSKLVLYIYIYS